MLLACEEMMIVVDSYRAIQQDLEIGFVTMMAISPNGELIIAYTQEDTLFVLSSGKGVLWLRRSSVCTFVQIYHLFWNLSPRRTLHRSRLLGAQTI